LSQFKPQLAITDKIFRLKSQVVKHEKRALGFHATTELLHNAHVRSAYATLAIENNGLSLEEVTDIIEGRYVSCTQNEMREVKNAYEAYSLLDIYHPPNPYSTTAILHAHSTFMTGIAKDAGRFRTTETAAQGRGTIAPNLIPRHVENLLEWVNTSDEHPLIKSCVFHHEIMYAKPFRAGNGLIARLWQILLLSFWSMPMGLPLAAYLLECRENYYNALAIQNKTESTAAFVAVLLQAIKDAVVEYDK